MAWTNGHCLSGTSPSPAHLEVALTVNKDLSVIERKPVALVPLPIGPHPVLLYLSEQKASTPSFRLLQNSSSEV